MRKRIAVFMLIGFGLPVASLGDVTPVRDVENPARSPFALEGSVELMSVGTELGRVPAGKRAVIEFISIECVTVPPDTIIRVSLLFPETNLLVQEHVFPISKQGDPFGTPNTLQSWATAQLVRIYADEGRISFAVRTAKGSADNQGACSVQISGHTIRVK